MSGAAGIDVHQSSAAAAGADGNREWLAGCGD
jgi:hypothetical protein